MSADIVVKLDVGSKIYYEINLNIENNYTTIGMGRV